MPNLEGRIQVEVVYATPATQRLVSVDLPGGATVEQAVRASGLLEEFPRIELGKTPVGIFGRACVPGRALKTGDRVEIYRSLKVDPKQARRNAVQRGGSDSSRGGSGSSGRGS